jgi:hypothetical protein
LLIFRLSSVGIVLFANYLFFNRYFTVEYDASNRAAWLKNKRMLTKEEQAGKGCFKMQLEHTWQAALGSIATLLLYFYGGSRRNLDPYQKYNYKKKPSHGNEAVFIVVWSICWSKEKVLVLDTPQWL